MTCRRWLDLIDEHLDGHPASALADHAADCPDCAERLFDAERLLGGLDAFPPIVPPADLAGRIADAVNRRPRVGRWAGRAALVAAAALLLVLVRPDPPRPSSPSVAVRPPLRDSVGDAGRAVASLTARTAAETAQMLPPVPMPAIAPPPTPPLEPLADSVSESLQPLTDPARRAVSLFFRDLPLNP